MSNNWYVYIVECKNGSLYTGITTDLERRVKEHREGEGAKYTRANKIKKLVFSESCATRSDASKREIEIKKMSRAQKVLLIKRVGVY